MADDHNEETDVAEEDVLVTRDQRYQRFHKYRADLIARVILVHIYPRKTNQ